MKNVILTAAISFALGVGSVFAQDDNTSYRENGVEIESEEAEIEADDAQVYNNDGVKTSAERRADREDKSKAGEALHATGSLIGSGAKAAGKGIVNAAEWTGENIADGASWTWDKAKHNKLTKNVFNQPGDE